MHGQALNLDADAIAAVFAARSNAEHEQGIDDLLGLRPAGQHSMDYYLDYANAVIEGPGAVALDIVLRFV